VDFYQLNEEKEISMNIPVVVEGAAPGVLNSGGTLILNKRKLRVRALPKNLPDFIVADISGLELGNKLYTSQIAAEEYSFLHPDNTVVCQVKTSRASIKSAAEEEATEEATEEAAE
jgi:large subunit ribosomal protein L25